MHISFKKIMWLFFSTNSSLLQPERVIHERAALESQLFIIIISLPVLNITILYNECMYLEHMSLCVTMRAYYG